MSTRTLAGTYTSTHTGTHTGTSARTQVNPFDINSRVQQMQQPAQTATLINIESPQQSPTKIVGAGATKKTHSSQKITAKVEKSEFIILPKEYWSLDKVKYGIRYKTEDNVLHDYCTVHKVETLPNDVYIYLCSKHVSKDKPRRVWKISTKNIKEIYVYREHNAHLIKAGGSDATSVSISTQPSQSSQPSHEAAESQSRDYISEFANSIKTPGASDTGASIGTAIAESAVDDSTNTERIDALELQVQTLQQSISRMEENLRDMFTVLHSLYKKTSQ